MQQNDNEDCGRKPSKESKNTKKMIAVEWLTGQTKYRGKLKCTPSSGQRLTRAGRAL